MGAGTLKNIKYILNCLISIFYCGDDKCVMCGGFSEEIICRNCARCIKITGVEGYVGRSQPVYPCYSLGYYSYGIKKLLLLYKFHKNFDAGRVLGSYLSQCVDERFKNKIDYITYIPSSRQSMKKRGFNQCKVLCENVSRICHIPYIETLKRVDRGIDQIGLTGEQRWENLKGAFIFMCRKDIGGKNILIIDDVLTTGATAYYAAEALDNAGASNIYILTVAKSKV